MLLIDRYILKLFFLYLAGGIFVFVTLFLTADVMSFALKHADAGTGTLLRYYAYHTPAVLYQLLPVACLTATLFTLSTLNRTNEMTALFSMGTSLRRIVTPILLAVAVVSGVAFGVSDRVLPRLMQKKNYVELVEIKKRPGLYSTVKTNKIWFRTENILYNIKVLQPETMSAQDITLYYFDPNWDLTQVITAKHVNMKGTLWELRDGLVTLFAPENTYPLAKPFTEKTITMNEDLGDIQSSSSSSEIMSLAELSRFIDRNKEAGLNTLPYEVDFHAKFGFAFAGFVMSLVGIPFSVGRTRSGGTFLSVGICLALTFLYWIAYTSGIILGEQHYLPPVVAAWGPNILAVAVSLYLFKRLRR